MNDKLKNSQKNVEYNFQFILIFVSAKVFGFFALSFSSKVFKLSQLNFPFFFPRYGQGAEFGALTAVRLKTSILLN